MEENLQQSEKKAYCPPKLLVYGDIDSITKGNNSGNFLDKDFPAGTSFSDLTFSG